MFQFFVVVLKHWQSNFAKNDASGEVLFVSHTHDLQGFIYNRIGSSFPFLQIADWPFLSCDAESVRISEPGREERGRKKKRGERRTSFLSSPGILSAWLVKASTARYSGTLRNAGHARTISCV